jgi:leucyl/phenylalanyl-tRNA--protein transferase
MIIPPDLLLRAYAAGIFPMADRRGRVRWYDPDPRAILPLDSFHVPRRLARTLRKAGFELRVDHDFASVIAACAEPLPGSADRDETWISPGILASYLHLHELGFAHSVEAHRNGRLVGGLYGVALRGLFAGESMFSRERDASKVALVYLVERLRHAGFTLLDTQFLTPHLASFGALEIPRVEYQARLAEALGVDAHW